MGLLVWGLAWSGAGPCAASAPVWRVCAPGCAWVGEGASLCWCVLVCARVFVCVCAWGRRGAGHRTGGAPPRSHPAHLRSVPSFCLSACLPCLPCLPAAPPPPSPLNTLNRAPAAHQAGASRAPGGSQGRSRVKVGWVSAGARAGSRSTPGGRPHPTSLPRRRGVALRRGWNCGAPQASWGSAVRPRLLFSF